MAEEKSPENAAATKQELKEKSHEEYQQRMKGKPTPTQEENDLVARGAHLHEHEDDGSGPDPNVAANKQTEARKPAAAKSDYQTRQSGPARHTPSHGGGGSSST